MDLIFQDSWNIMLILCFNEKNFLQWYLKELLVFFSDISGWWKLFSDWLQIEFSGSGRIQPDTCRTLMCSRCGKIKIALYHSHLITCFMFTKIFIKDLIFKSTVSCSAPFVLNLSLISEHNYFDNNNWKTDPVYNGIQKNVIVS